MKTTLLLAALAGSLMAQVAEFRVREADGLRRFGYPVRARFASNAPAASLRLLEEGKPVPAQFTALGEGSIEVDFHVNNGPFEIRRFRVERGEGPSIKGGLTVEDSGGSFAVRYSTELEFHVPKNLSGLLSLVRTPRASYVRAPSPGLLLHHAGGTAPSSAATKASVLKSGPLAALLRFEGAESLPGGRRVSSVVELEFPRSKSWVEVRWRVEDPEGLVGALAAELDLLLEDRPMLVDFGAGSMVYAALRPQQGALFQAEPGAKSWRIDVAGRPYAEGKGPVEGWAHVMDRTRATAVAVQDFAAFSQIRRDSIAVSPEGRLTIRRDFSGGRERTLVFWLHFVDMPVQIGAATSPQSMMHPPVVEFE